MTWHELESHAESPCQGWDMLSFGLVSLPHFPQVYRYQVFSDDHLSTWINKHVP